MSVASERKKKRYAESVDFRLRTLASNRAFYAANKDAINAERRRKRAEKPDPNRKQRKYYAESERRAWLKHYYGITPEEYDALLERQGGLCAICRERPPEKLCVDHCHITDLVRGLLCRLCNFGLGHFKDDLGRLRAAIAYLEAFEARAGRRGSVRDSGAASSVFPLPAFAGRGWPERSEGRVRASFGQRCSGFLTMCTRVLDKLRAHAEALKATLVHIKPRMPLTRLAPSALATLSPLTRGEGRSSRRYFAAALRSARRCA